MTGPVAIRLAGAAEALGLHPDPDVFGEMLVSAWLELRARTRRTS